MKINALYASLLCILLAGPAQAQNPTESVSRELPAFATLGDVFSQGALAAESAEKSLAVPLAPAPPLTRMFVFAVGSTNCNWEYMTSVGQLATTCNHGGAQMSAAVLEIGYGSNPIAWMSGTVLPNSANYQTTPVCIVGTRYDWPCSPGATIVGFLRYYNLNGYQNGLFRYQNTSINAPMNTLSTRINIL